jgi:hypothetical protein
VVRLDFMILEKHKEGIDMRYIYTALSMSQMLEKIRRSVHMKIIHPAIRSAVFRLIETCELDISLSSEDTFSLKIELLQSLDDSRVYRYRAWRYEFFRLQSTFPQDANGQIHQPSDEIILVAFSLPGFNPFEEYYANDSKQAILEMIDRLGQALEHITATKIKIIENDEG